LFAGYVCGRKGAYAVAEAARLFLPPYPDLRLVYLGELADEGGVRADRQIREIAGPELSHRILCVGRVKRQTLLTTMRHAKVFVYPSRLETCGLVVGEAMLAGLPVVTSTGNPFPEYLTNEVTGLLVPPDSPAALGSAVRRLIDSPELAQRLSTAAHRE